MLLCIAGLALGCGLGSRLDESGNAVVGGRVYRHGEDYGPIGEAAFRRALSEDLATLHATALRPEFAAQLPELGKLYCSVKGDHPQDFWHVEGEASSKLQETGNGPWSADEVIMMDVAAKLADDTFCPSGYPNPVLSYP
ncbi:MAG TPA: hypothetical protein VII86_16040 [Thermoanaerobaculia bacterium]